MASRYQRLPADEAPAPWRTFFVILAGRTIGAHESIVQFFKSLGQTEVDSPEDADYCLLFCPVASRVGTDVGDAMERLPGGKEAVLVVMHHTFNPDQLIPPSRRLVDDRRVRLTLDCLFYQDKLLRCEFNRNMETDVQKFLRASRSNTWMEWFLSVLWSIFIVMVMVPAAVLEPVLDKIGPKRPLRRVWNSPFSRCMIFVVAILVAVYYLFGNETDTTANPLRSDAAAVDNNTLSVSEVHD